MNSKNAAYERKDCRILMRALLFGVSTAVLALAYPMTSHAMPSGLLEENRKPLEFFVEALWLGEWDYESPMKTVITADSMTPERLSEYIVPLADSYGWARKSGEYTGKVWKETDLKKVLTEAMGVTGELADQAVCMKHQDMLSSATGKKRELLKKKKWEITIGDWGCEYPETHIEKITDLGNDLYQIDGRVDFVDESGYFPTIKYPFVSVFRENQDSRFGELTLVCMEIN